MRQGSRLREKKTKNDKSQPDKTKKDKTKNGNIKDDFEFIDNPDNRGSFEAVNFHNRLEQLIIEKTPNP